MKNGGTSLIIEPVLSRSEVVKYYKLEGKWERYCLYCFLSKCRTEANPHCLIRLAKEKVKENKAGGSVEYFSVSEVAEMIGQSRQHVNRKILRGLGDGEIVKVKGSWRIPKDLLRLFENE